MLGASPYGSKEDMLDTVKRATSDGQFKKKITLLGSTGSIGTQTLDICEYLPVRGTPTVVVLCAQMILM